MSLAWEEFQTAYLSAAADIKEIIDSDILGKLCTEIIQTQHLPAESYSLVIGILSRVVLGITVDKDSIVTLLEPLTISHSSKVSLAQIIYTSAINTKNHSAAVQPTSTVVTTTPLVSDIAETEAMIASAPTVRTMARDMHDLKSQTDISVPSYASNQAATLGSMPTPQRAVPTPPPPARTTKPAARWGSETE